MMLRATNILKSHFTSLDSRISRISPLYWNISFPFSFPGRPSWVPLWPLLCLPCLLLLFPLLLNIKMPHGSVFRPLFSSLCTCHPGALNRSPKFKSSARPSGGGPVVSDVTFRCRGSFRLPPSSPAPGRLPAKPPCLRFFPLESSFPDFHVTCSRSPSQLLFTCRAFLDLCPSICPCPFRPWALYLFTG